MGYDGERNEPALYDTDHGNYPAEEYYAGTEDPLWGARYEVTTDPHRRCLICWLAGNGPYRISITRDNASIGIDLGGARTLKGARKRIRKDRKRSASPALVYAEQDGAEILPDLRTVTPA